MNKILSLLLVALSAFGCASDYDTDTAVFGTTSEELSVKIRPNGTYGANRNNDTGLGCKGVTGEFCVMPSKKVLKVKFDPSLLNLTIAGQNVHTLISAAFAKATLASSSNFSFQEVTSGQDVTLLRTVGQCHGTSTSIAISDYVCFDNTAGLTPLTEGFQGSYYAWSTGFVVLFDLDDMLAKATNNNTRLNLMDHMFKTGALYTVGLGTTTVASKGGSSTIDMSIADAQRPIMTDGQKCAAASFNTASPTTFSTVDFCNVD